MKTLKTLFLAAILFALLSFDLPTGWYKSGSAADSYEIGIDKTGGQDGGNAATIKSIVDTVKGYGSLNQSCLPEKFLVKRIRMSGYMKSKDVADMAGFWLRADKEGSEQALSFDNMYDRPVKGTTDWKQYEIVVDIPPNTTLISYGALLSGKGQIWFNRLNFEVVDNSVPTTGKGNNYNLPQREPTNLNFER